MKKIIKSIVLLFFIGIIAAFFAFDLKQYMNRETFEQFNEQNSQLTMAAYFFIYIIMAACSLPGAALLTLVGGGVFGFTKGIILVSFSSTIGATLAFLAARYLLRDWVQQKLQSGTFRKKLEEINQGIEKEGALYLFALRLIPLVPFWVINLVMGLTPLSTFKFYLVSQLGMLPGTMAYVYAGSQLGQFKLSPQLFVSFAVLGILPIFIKKVVSYFKSRKVLKNFTRPNKFDYNMVVIGAGAAGLVTSYIAAAVKSKVALIEKHKMGGDCLNTGCVPSKALIRSAKMLSYAKRAKEFGFKSTSVDFDFADVMERIQGVIKKIEPHDSVDRYTKLGVDCIQGEAKITSPYTVSVGGRSLTTRSIVIATGAGPFVPPIPGLDKVSVLTSDNLWNLRSLPKNLLVLGGGPIGCELAQSFQRLGSQVTIVEGLDRIMAREDSDVSKIVYEKFVREGIRVLTGHKAKSVSVDGLKKILTCDYGGQSVPITFDEIIVAVGRRANVKGFGLEELKIPITNRGTIEINEYLQTIYPNIFVCGDVAGPYQFTHTAAHQAYYAASNALFGFLKMSKADYSCIPWCTYTDPEVARVGLSESEAKAQGIPYEVTVYEIDDLDRAIADSEDHGFVKVLTVPGKDKILGATIVGSHAGDIIIEYISAMRHGLGLKKIMATIHIYPTLVESNKFAAGNWSRNHVPTKALGYLKMIHAWRRG
ncbi:MAG: dihydrolipoyl dehydrogenase [Pseudomonadota bacterium]|nr:dihydrolipoyl dehydrogenase [Pseudomonadota bacterium]